MITSIVRNVTGPVEMEYLTWTGIIMFLDGLLYCLTFLPLKTIAALRDICIGHRQEKATLYPKQLYVLVQVWRKQRSYCT
jgi:hypothetical protein